MGNEVVEAVAEYLADVEYGVPNTLRNLTSSDRAAFVDTAKEIVRIVHTCEDNDSPGRMAIDVMLDEVCVTAQMSRTQMMYGRNRESAAARAAASFLCMNAITPRPKLVSVGLAVFGREDGGSVHHRIMQRHRNAYARVLTELTCRRLGLPSEVMEKYDRVPKKWSVVTGKDGMGAGVVCGGEGGTAA